MTCRCILHLSVGVPNSMYRHNRCTSVYIHINKSVILGNECKRNKLYNIGLTECIYSRYKDL